MHRDRRSTRTTYLLSTGDSLLHRRWIWCQWHFRCSGSGFRLLGTRAKGRFLRSLVCTLNRVRMVVRLWLLQRSVAPVRLGPATITPDEAL